MNDLISRFEGCFIGEALGQLAGRTHEPGHGVRAKLRMPARVEPDAAAFLIPTSRALLIGGDVDARLDAALLRELPARMERGLRVPCERDEPAPAMRSPAVALRYHGSSRRVLETASRQSCVTHLHRAAIAASVAVAEMTHLALSQVAPDWCLRGAVDVTRAYSPEFAARLGRVSEVIDSPADRAFHLLGKGGRAFDVVAAAVYCVMRSPRCYEGALALAATHPSAPGSVGALAGALSGAYLGIDAIPLVVRRSLPDERELQHAARMLHAVRFSVADPQFPTPAAAGWIKVAG